MVTSGKDFALVARTTWFFSTGIGRASAALTPRALYLFPEHTFAAGATTRTKTDFTIGGRRPYDAISGLVATPATSADALDQQLGEWAKQVDGPIVQDLAEIKRIRIFQGWFRRSVVLTKKESGYDLKPMSLRPTKEELPAFVELLKDRPGTELK
jgi:hypothetical protein